MARIRASSLATLCAAIHERRVFAATGFSTTNGGRPAGPVYRGRKVTFVLDERFHLTNADGPFPMSSRIDLGDGQGLRAVAWREPFAAQYAACEPEIELRRHYGSEVLTALRDGDLR